jgi:hypothetical protein
VFLENDFVIVLRQAIHRSNQALMQKNTAAAFHNHNDIGGNKNPMMIVNLKNTELRITKPPKPNAASQPCKIMTMIPTAQKSKLATMTPTLTAKSKHASVVLMAGYRCCVHEQMCA